MRETLEKANKLIFVKAYDEAESLIESLMEIEECYNDLRLHLRRIELGVKQNSIPNIIAGYKDALEKNPEDAVSILGLILAKQHADLLKPEQVTQQLQKYMEKYGPHPAAFYGIGYSTEIQGLADRALSNYEQCVNTDSTWYPGYFGLSQVCYQLGDDKKGDSYFYLFEEQAPYTVYGNFDTHKKLCEEFLQDEEFSRAAVAITSLSEWWVENKGFCPLEIEVYEQFSLAKISDQGGEFAKAKTLKSEAEEIVQQILLEKDRSEEVLFFIAKTLEEFSEWELALQFYKRILSMEIKSTELVQKIGNQFLSEGKNSIALDLFKEAYQANPDVPEIRLCLLIANLQNCRVDVDKYISGKESLKKLMIYPYEGLEILGLLQRLLSQYTEDPDIHACLAEVYSSLGNQKQAKHHHQILYQLDWRSVDSSLRFAAFEMEHGDVRETKSILARLDKVPELTCEQLIETHRLKSTQFFHEEKFGLSLQHLRKIQALDPWNVPYLVQEIANLMELSLDKETNTELPADSVMVSLLKNQDSSLDWLQFDRITKELKGAHQYELVYVRQKLRFIYATADEKHLQELVQAAYQFNPEKCANDLLKLLNTNFDGPDIYWALGMMFKELWQLETACMWFEQILILPPSSKHQKAKAYLELADCFVWRNYQIPKSIEFVKIAMELGEGRSQKSLTILAHGLLRAGEVRDAKIYLEDIDGDSDLEALYLKGLLEYRNGAKLQANTIWKPLLTMTSQNIRFHHIKQEVLRYYFEKPNYSKTGSMQ